MASEKSFQDRIQHGTELAAAVTLMNPAYAPVDEKYSLTALNSAVATAEMCNNHVEATRIPFTDASSDRAALVKTIGPLVTQSLAHVKSNTAWANRFEAAKNAADKVRGVRPPPARTADPDPDAKKRESGECSYVEIAAFLNSYITRLTGLTGYAPQDSKIDIAAFTTLWTNLDALNKSLPVTASALADAISDRKEAFLGATAFKFVFDGVKASVKGQYGQTSPQYKSVSGISW
jgi:hypothetical protein